MNNNQPLTAKIGEFPGTAKLPPVPVPSEAKAKTPKDYKTLEPVFVKMLYDRLESGTKVGDLVGVSNATITTALREGKIAMSVELAARGVWEREYEEKPKSGEKGGKVFVSMLIEKSTLKLLTPWLHEARVNFEIFG